MREPLLLEKMLTVFQQKGWREQPGDDSGPIPPMCWPRSAPRSACYACGKRCAQHWTALRLLLQIGCVPIADQNGWSAMVLVVKIRARLWGKLKGKLLRDLIGRQGRELLDALFDPTTPEWLHQVPAVELLRQVWVQNYQRIDDVVRWRRSREYSSPITLHRLSLRVIWLITARSEARRGLATKCICVIAAKLVCLCSLRM